MTTRAERLAKRFDPSPAASPPVEAQAGPAVERWEDVHQRFTVWLPRHLVTDAKAAANTRQESIATLVARALRNELGPPRAD